jgi:N-acetylmuramoyl-L-alanine amidase
MGFISNGIEGELLNSEEGQDEIARAIAEAIVSYRNEYFSEETVYITEPKLIRKNIEKIVKDTVYSEDKTNISSEIKKTEPEGLIYKVQIVASIKKIALQPKNFKGLEPISMEPNKKTYIYMFGETTDYEEAKKQLQVAKSKGYKSSFLIAYKDGVKISIQDALKL